MFTSVNMSFFELFYLFMFLVDEIDPLYFILIGGDKYLGQGGVVCFVVICYHASVCPEQLWQWRGMKGMKSSLKGSLSSVRMAYVS